MMSYRALGNTKPQADEITQTELVGRAARELAGRQELPGITQMQRFTLCGCDAAGRRLELRHTVEEWELNNYATMHGGLICCALDSAMGMLCRSYTGDICAPTLDIHVSFLRAVRAGETLNIRAELTHIARGVLRARAEAWTAEPGKLCATAEAAFYRSEKSGGAEAEK